MKRYIPILIGALCALIIMALFYFWPGRREAIFYPMGGIPFRIICYDRSDFKFKGDLKGSEKKVEALEKVFNAYDIDSELSKINRAPKKDPILASTDVLNVLKESINWWKQSAGSFDVTVAPLIFLWKDAAQKNEIPSGEEIIEVQRDVGLDKIAIEGDGSIIFYREGVKLDFGGIAKGYIIDEVGRLLKERGVKRGVVDAGGDILAFGKGSFRFGVQDPTAKARMSIIGDVEMPAGAIVTSGNYERFMEVQGRKYSHIIHPRLGYPINNELVAATVIGRSCMEADALATALMVMGLERAKDYLKKNTKYEGILVEKNDKEYIVWVSQSLKPHLNLEKPWSDWVRTF